MKKLIVVLMLLSVSMYGCGLFSKVGGESGSVNGGVIDRSQKILLSIACANIAFVKAIEKMDIALGHGERAAKYNALLETLEKEKTNPTAVFDSIAKVNELTRAHTSLTASKVVLDDSSKVHMKEALLYTAGGMAAEAFAAKKVADLLVEAKDELLKAKSEMSLGRVAKMGTVIDDLRKVAEEVPAQVKIISKLAKRNSEIAKLNNLDLPTDKDVNDIVAKINKGEL